MKTFQAEVTVSANRHLTIELPENFETGIYQVVVVMNPSARAELGLQPPTHSLSALAGKVNSFSTVDAVEWQQQMRNDWHGD